VQGGLSGSGNINADPTFVRNPSPGSDGVWGTADDDYGDLRLQPGSPCIDAGSGGPGVATDFAGNPRIAGTSVDMGAYEFQPPPVQVVSNSFDVNASSGPTVKFVFPRAMATSTMAASDLTVRIVQSDGSLGGTVSAVAYSYDSATFTVSFALPASTADNNYRATLPANSVTDSNGGPLSADSSLDFFILAGDANRDRKVDISDLLILANNYGGVSKVFGQGDFNYDTKVDNADLAILSANWQRSLTPPPAALPVSAPRRPATRTPVHAVELVG
jgi:hypothetical protein